MTRRFCYFLLINLLLMGILAGCTSGGNKDSKKLVQEEGELYYGDSVWGMSQKEIRKLENGKLTKESEDVLVYETEYQEIPIQAIYMFSSNDELCKVSCIKTESKDLKQGFTNILDTLTKTYGASDETIILGSELHSWEGEHTKAVLNLLNAGELTVSMEFEDTTIPRLDFDTQEEAEILEKNSLVSVADVCEFSVLSITEKDEILPSNPEGYYSYYEGSEDSQYVDVTMSIKNMTSKDASPSELTYLYLSYDDKYEYRGFYIEDANSDIETFVNIIPLETKEVHYIIEVPNEVLTSGKALALYVKAGENTYIINAK